MADPKPKRVFRSRGQAITIALIGLLVAVGYPIQALKPTPHPSVRVRFAFAAASVVVGGYCLLRLARLCVFVFEGGVKVRKSAQFDHRALA